MTSTSNIKINVCLACDDNYAKYAGLVIASVLANANNNDNLSFYILNDGINDVYKKEILSLKNIKDCSINFISINNSLFNEYKNIKTFKYISMATYYRLKIATLLKDVSKVIYLDCDTLVNTSLAELFNTEINSFPIAGVKDIDAPYFGYVNAGVLLFNLDFMRKNNIEEKFCKWTYENANLITRGDQEIINSVCKNQIKVIDDNSWNVQTGDFSKRSSFTRNPKIVHYIGKYKPWSFVSLSYHKKFYSEYIRLTPWKMSALQNFTYNFIEQPLSFLLYIVKKPTFWLNSKFYIAIYKTLKGGCNE